MRASPHIVFASTNIDKFHEVTHLMEAHPGIRLVSPVGILRNADKIGLVENYATYLENSAAKARLVNQGCHYPALADDSGLEISALGGKPGIHSQRFVKLGGYPSAISQSKANIDEVLKLMKEHTDRSARFVSVLTLIIEGVMLHGTGILEGSIAEAPRGEMGFGYDSIFIPKGEKRTLAEITFEEKNAISHRALALQQIMDQVKALGIQIAKP
jgi:XTP/dITP diphosphohydrolase